MNEERKMILKMIQDGKITSEEGLALLEELEKTKTDLTSEEKEIITGTATYPSHRHFPHQSHEREIAKISNFAAGTHVPEIPPIPPVPVVHSIPSIQSIAISEPVLKKNEIQVKRTLKISPFPDEQIDISTFNGFIKYHTWEQDYAQIHITGIFSEMVSEAEANTLLDQNLIQHHDDETYALRIENKQMNIGGVFLEVFIPRNHYSEMGGCSCGYENIKLTTSNGFITVENLQAEQTEITTSNGAVLIHGIQVEQLKVTTSNGAIELQGVSSETVQLITSNGRILMNEMHGEQLEAITSNGAIESNGVDMGSSCTFNTSEGPIMMKGLTTEMAVASTSNGPIEGIDVMIEEGALSTSNGPIKWIGSFNNIKCDTSNGPIEVQQTEQGKSEIRANTTNGPIRIQYPKNIAGVHGELSTKCGKAECTLNGVQIVEKTQEKDHQRIVFRQGDEQLHYVQANTSGGSVTVL